MLLSNCIHLLLHLIKLDLDPACKFLSRIVCNLIHLIHNCTLSSTLIGISQRGQDECCVRVT